MIDDGFLDIRPVGNDIETACCGCGEPILICSGDQVHFRSGGKIGIMGVEVPVPSGLLCFACNKAENGEDEMSVKFVKLACSRCGGDMTDPEFDEDGNLKDLVCGDCLNPWRREE